MQEGMLIDTFGVEEQLVSVQLSLRGFEKRGRSSCCCLDEGLQELDALIFTRPALFQFLGLLQESAIHSWKKVSLEVLIEVLERIG